MSEITKRKKGQMLNNTERQLILNLMNYLKKKNPDKSVSEIIREISNATGCSERTIYKIKKEGSKGITAFTNRTRLRKKENKNSRNVKYDSFVKSSIRKKIYSYFFHNNSPTLNTILCLVNNDPDLPNFKRSTLHTLLKEIGFVYKQKGKKSLLTENKDLVDLRQEYLNTVEEFRKENRWIVYTGKTVISLVSREINKNMNFKCACDIVEQHKSENFKTVCETVNTVFINAPETVNEGMSFLYRVNGNTLENVVVPENLQLREGMTVIQKILPNADNISIHSCSQEDIRIESLNVQQNKESNLELRLTVMHAGNSHGLVQGVDCISLSKKRGEDVDSYKNWFLEKLLPKIPPNSVVVTDVNMLQHKREENFPDSSWKKQKIKNWLLAKNIQVEHLFQKKELLSAVDQVRPMYSINYKIGEMAQVKGIIILSLPPFHYELNPLNMAWAHIKRYVRSNIKSFKVKKIKQLIHESFYTISQLNWTNYMHCVREVEDLLQAIDGHQEKHQDFSVIQPKVLEKNIKICKF